MTLLVGWLGVDHRGPSSLYLASDSRISWGVRHSWDFGRKLFSCGCSPDVFGYVGDVIFPSITLGQVVSAAEHGLLAGFPEGDAKARHEVFKETVMKAYSKRQNAPEADFTLVHAARDLAGMSSEFRVWALHYRATTREWNDEIIPINKKESSVFDTWGSGATFFSTHYKAIKADPQGRTSRAVMWALSDFLKSGDDPLSGGAPQMVGMYREGAAKAFAVSFENEQQFFGLPIKMLEGETEVETRDELFQRVSLITKQPIAGGQRHARALKKNHIKALES